MSTLTVSLGGGGGGLTSHDTTHKTNDGRMNFCALADLDSYWSRVMTDLRESLSHRGTYAADRRSSYTCGLLFRTNLRFFF